MTQQQFTKEEVGAAIRTIKAVADAIKEAGRIPNGHLYATMMQAGVSLATYEKIIGILTRSQLVKIVQHELIWVCSEQNT